MSVEVAQRNMGYLLEGPHWDDVTNTLLYVDIYGKTIHRYNPVTQQAEKIVLDDMVGVVVPTQSGKLLVGSGHRLAIVDWKSGNLDIIHEVDKGKRSRFNDGKCDSKGRFWAGTMGEEDTSAGAAGTLKGEGTLYCLHPDRKLVGHLQNVDISNGLAWSADRRTMYYIDSLKYGVDALDYNYETGEISNRRQVIKVPVSDGFADGMCIDSEGMLWVALFGGAAVSRYNPNTGEKLRTIKFPTNHITSCCWGGANHDELYVTSAEHHLSKDQLKEQPTAGSLFRVTGLGVTGVKCDAFDDSRFTQSL